MFGIKIPQSIFVHAEGFHKLSQTPVDWRNPYDASVLVTNSAIASELYIKCLIYIEKGQLIKKLHNLKQLFATLPEETRTTIQQRFDEILAKQPTYDRSGASPEHAALALKVAESMPKNLIDALRKGADAFVEWRYLYEDENEWGNPFALFNLPHVLRGVILERKPEWAHFRFKSTMVGTPQPTSPTR